MEDKPSLERNQRTIFVGNLPASYDHRELSKLFKSCGPIESARIRSVVPDKEKLAPKVALITKRIHPKVDSVNGYVVFEHNTDDEPIKKALALNGRQIDGHHIRVDRANMPNSKRMTLTSRKKSVFVGNMRFDIRDDDLINHFKKIGAVKYVRIVRDRATGLGKGFGFVVFEDRASVKKALELNDTKFKGRQIRVKKIDEEDKQKNEKKTKTKKENSDETIQEDADADPVSESDTEKSTVPKKILKNGSPKSKKHPDLKKNVSFKSDKIQKKRKIINAKPTDGKPKNKLTMQSKKKMLKNKVVKLKRGNK